MPCIIDQNSSTSKQTGSIWQSLCGKTLWLDNKPFKSAEDALKSGQPICRKCRKLAGLPTKQQMVTKNVGTTDLKCASKDEVNVVMDNLNPHAKLNLSYPVYDVQLKDDKAGGYVVVVGGVNYGVFDQVDKDGQFVFFPRRTEQLTGFHYIAIGKSLNKLNGLP